MTDKPLTKPADNGKHPGGRPPKYDTPAVMQAHIDAYFADCSARLVTPTVQGLAVALDFEAVQSLVDYAARPKFSGIVKKAKLRIEAALAERLGGSNATGTIFNLKVNFGWTETTPVQRVETKHTIEGDTIKKYKEWLDS